MRGFHGYNFGLSQSLPPQIALGTSPKYDQSDSSFKKCIVAKKAGIKPSRGITYLVTVVFQLAYTFQQRKKSVLLNKQLNISF